jgi:hypothetical protein
MEEGLLNGAFHIDRVHTARACSWVRLLEQTIDATVLAED